MTQKLLLVAVLSAFLLYGVESFKLHKREAEESSYLSSATDFFKGVWDTASERTAGMIDTVKSWDIEEKVKKMYSESVGAFGTYVDITRDQLFHMWNPQ
ncbi:apolipoprotein C-II-like [Erpetoichthys calabaricus]|uniref:apolipoprotein C-II-like n=1 Tax=Erpetoichthys calabaricus TaxID=27687 RepID=UPI002233F512|nr:apolipoprotein C-II-like [Erpetoichthys calabaricus]